MPVCFIGHRPQRLGPGAFEHDSPVRQRLRAVLQTEIERLLSNGSRTFIRDTLVLCE